MLSISLSFSCLLRSRVGAGLYVGRKATSTGLAGRSNLCLTRSVKITLFGREFGWGGTFNKR